MFYQWGSLAYQAHKALISVGFLGSVFVFLPTSQQNFAKLRNLEQKMESRNAIISGASPVQFRSALYPKKGVLDGDLLASFLHLSPAQQKILLGEENMDDGQLGEITRVLQEHLSAIV